MQSEISQLTESFIQEFNEWKISFQQKGKEKLKEVFNSFWQSNPGINVVVWTQYTPYSMDGEPCEFSVNDVTFSNATEEEDIDCLSWGEYEGDTESIWALLASGVRYQDFKCPHGVDVDSLKFLNNFIISDAMEDILKDILGPDQRVIVTREGIKSVDFSKDHD